MNKESFGIEKIESSSHQIHCYSFPICEKCLAKIREIITRILYPELEYLTLFDTDTGDGDKTQDYGGLQDR